VDVARTLRGCGYELVTVLRIGGPLASDFAAASDRVVREPLTWLRVVLRYFRRTRTLATRLEQCVARHVLRREQPSIAYLNTVKAACYVRPAVELGIPAVLHVHELEPLASSTLARYRLEHIFERVRLVACSEGARDNLADVAGVVAAAITVIPPRVDVDSLVAQSRAPSGAVTPVSDETLVVGACGTADYRKGADLWLQMAAHICSARPDLPVRFRWVGRAPDREFQRLAERLGIDDRVDATGELANPYPDLAAMDVFTLPSRTDAFPLVVLEAMALGRAVVAFALPGVVGQLGDAGILVAEGDPGAMADAALDLLEHADRRRVLGARAVKRVHAHFGFGRLRADAARVVAETLASRGTLPTA
jgi:glycosyltransferase involved in cell wall biosynthesis